MQALQGASAPRHEMQGVKESGHPLHSLLRYGEQKRWGSGRDLDGDSELADGLSGLDELERFCKRALPG